MNGINGAKTAFEYNYLKFHSDCDAADAWLEKNIDKSDIPPLTFAYGTVNSSELSWAKKVGELQTVTDYPESDKPVLRMYREIVYTCVSESLEIKLTVTSYPDYPVVEYKPVIINLSSEISETLSNVCAADTALEVPAGNKVTAHYNKGSTNDDDDFEPYVRDLSVLELECGDDGRPTNEYLPEFNYEFENGGGVISVVNWQASWKMKSEFSDGRIIFKAGQKNASFQLLPGEEYNAPGIVYLFYKNGDWQEGQNVWRRWMIDHNMMRYTGRRDYRQNLYICSGSYDPDVDIDALKKDATLGISDELSLNYIIDAGWYPEGLDNWYHTGNYYPGGKFTHEKFLEISEVCKASGFGFTLWFEPERIYADTKQAEDLGDNVIYLNEDNHFQKYSTLGKEQKADTMGLINYGVPEVEDYVVNMIDTAVKTYGLTNYRQDYNTDIARFFIQYDEYESGMLGINRTGMTESKYCRGYINAWSRIAKLNPGLTFDCCASGGRRMDLESMRYSFVHTKSDNWVDPNSQKGQNFALYSRNIFTGTSFDTMDETDIRTRLTLSIGVGVLITEKKLEVYKKWAAQQKYLYKDYYSLGKYSYDWTTDMGLQFNDYEKGEGMITGYITGDFTFVPHGLSPESEYTVSDADGRFETFTASGLELMTKGIAVKSDCKTAVQIGYKKIESH